MKRSWTYWAGIVLLAIIPLLLIDIAEHNVNWKKEVREEMISAVHDHYEMSRAEKAVVLDRILERNQVLNALIYLKSFACCILLVASLFLLTRPRKEKRSSAWVSIGMAVAVMIAFTGVKVLWAGVISNKHIRFLPQDADALSLREIQRNYFPGKVLYVDFWGTTCGPCLKEFRDYTPPLKKRFSGRNDIAYLYLSCGNRYTWKQQLQKYQLEGDHLFLDADNYARLFREAAGDPNVRITMPRYIILDKQGVPAVNDAKRPSEKDSLYAQLERYLR